MKYWIGDCGLGLVLGLWMLCGWRSAGWASEAAAPIRVITYNIHHGEGSDHKVDLDRIATIIREARADIVCLQEVDRNLPRTHRMDFPSLLAQELSMTVVFEPNFQSDGGDYGNATLTRFEVVSHENIRLPSAKQREPRGCCRTTLRINGRLVDVLNTHLSLDAAERKDQADAILKALRDVPTMLAGDMNETRVEPAVRLLMTRFRDVAVGNSGNNAATFPSNQGTRRIDLILVSEGIDILSSRLFSTPETAVASDHLPLVADLQIRAPADKPSEEGIRDNDDERVTEAIVEGT
jgi:endonuclease/exonuclease/phosphatase family metal-dependent hydrolase